MFDFGCGDAGGFDAGADGAAATCYDSDYTAGYGLQYGYNESAADGDTTFIDLHNPELHNHESTDIASYFDSWHSSSNGGDIWWRKLVIPVMCGIIFVFILVFSFKVTKGSGNK